MMIKNCINCGSDDIDINDCGYSSFNVAYGKCKNCNNEVLITNCSWNISKDEIIKSWNNENDPEILKLKYENEILILQKKIKKLPK